MHISYGLFPAGVRRSFLLGLGISIGCPGPYQAFGPEADQILASRFDQGFFYQFIIAGIPVLYQGPLHGLLMGITADINVFSIPGVDAGIVHHCGYRGRGWIEILHLLGHIAYIPQLLRQRSRCL